jgi:hypothetical protein
MPTFLYATIWIALVLFVAGQHLRRPLVWLTGALMCAVHIAIAMSWRYRWSHDLAVRATARQSAAVYGIDWGGGVYLNYVFVAAWMVEGLWWTYRPASYASRPGAVKWAARLFYLVIIVNAAVIFASGPGRLAGVPLVAWLAAVWLREQAKGRPTSPMPSISSTI